MYYVLVYLIGFTLCVGLFKIFPKLKDKADPLAALICVVWPAALFFLITGYTYKIIASSITVLDKWLDK